MLFRPNILRLILLGMALCLCPTLAAQTLRLASVQISGSKRLPADRVAAASGLTLGQSVSLQDLQKAADRLAQLGLFEYVTYRYQTTATTIAVEFVVEETASFRPCEFDNFVWLSPEDLFARLKKEIPLFTGEAPPGGFLVEQIQKALEKILAERGIRARAVHLGPLSEKGGVNLFRIEGVAIPVASLRFVGPKQLGEAELLDASQDLLAQDYSYSFLLGFEQHTLLPLYHRRGFLRAAFAPSQVEYLGETEGAHPIVLTVPIKEGDSYRLEEIRWSGNEVLSTEELNHRVSLKRGDVANTVQLQADLDKIREEEYGGRGYIQAQFRLVSEFDDAARTATLTVQVDEDGLYRFQALLIEGLPPRASEELNRRWKLKPGEPYSVVYAKSFLKEDVAAVLKRLSAQPRAVSSHLVRDDDQKTVTLVLRFQ